MPPWIALTPQNRVDLVSYIKTFSPRWAGAPAPQPIAIPAETPATIESILHGREQFQRLECWKCHGPAGHGDGPSASTLTDSKDNPIRPYNFSTGSRFKCGSTNADLYRIFMTGLDGTPMPSFIDNLQPNEAWDLVHFLRTLQPIATPESTDLAGLAADASGRAEAHRPRRRHAMNRFLTPTIGALALVGLATAATDAPAAARPAAGTISGTVTYTGTPPKMRPIDMSKEPSCASQHTTPVMTENVVTGPGNSVQYAVVYISAGDQAGRRPDPGRPLRSEGLPVRARTSR